MVRCIAVVVAVVVGAAGVGHADEARPFGQTDLAAASSVGVSASYGRGHFSGYYGSSAFSVGELAFDAAYVRGRGRVFASIPIGYRDPGYRGGDEARIARGNLTVGAVRTGRPSAATRLGLGASLSFGAGESAGLGFSLRHDAAGYAEATVIRLFLDSRVRAGAGFGQLQLAYSGWTYDGGESDGGGHSIGSASVGGGIPLGGQVWVVGDAGVLQYLSRGAAEPDSTMFLANLGVRTRADFAPRGSLGARASVHSGDGYTTVGFSLELRADLDR